MAIASRGFLDEHVNHLQRFVFFVSGKSTRTGLGLAMPCLAQRYNVRVLHLQFCEYMSISQILVFFDYSFLTFRVL